MKLFSYTLKEQTDRHAVLLKRKLAKGKVVGG